MLDRMNPVGSIPFHVAQAYGVRGARAVPIPASRTTAPVAPSVPGPAGSGSLRLYHPQGGSKANPQVSRLVAAVVPGSIDFSAGGPQAGGGGEARVGLAMYHHPADRNAAATGVGVGRMLDTSA